MSYIVRSETVKRYVPTMQEGKSERTRREEYTEATRQALLSAGRNIFMKEGFQGARIEAVSRAARVTRGALYHHFEDKKALFDAVVVSMQAEATIKVEQSSRPQRGTWDKLVVGIGAYLDVCLDPAYARIVIQEAPAVLGAQRYREIEEAYPGKLLIASFNALKRRDELDCNDVELLSGMVDAMICKVALMLPETKDPRQLRKRGHSVIIRLLAGFRKTA
jgi:AcrR family transcriptional regulator